MLNRRPISLLIALFAMTGDVRAITFEKNIRPILREHCYDCHGAAKELKGQLDLRLRRLMVKGGKSGAAIVPGDPSASRLLTRIREGEMPPNGKLVPSDQVSVLEKWIKAGAPTARPEPESIGEGLGITEEERSYWAFQPIRRPSVPNYTTGVRTPIDALLLKRLKQKEISLSPEAGKLTLIRRAYFGLIGLPPKPEAVKKFLADKSSTAYEDLIDELLASKNYGERWARHWLDIAGYADSEGHTEVDIERPYAWRYRDYVIQSLNDDKPFDRFITEQLAGDELMNQPKGDLTPQQIELLTATGFLRMAADGTSSGANTTEGQNQVIADTLKIVSTSLLGLSVGCAQCHDHRYDPISQKDYYHLRAVFEPAFNGAGWQPPTRRRVSLYTEADRKAAGEIEKVAVKLSQERSAKQKEFVLAAFAKQLETYPKDLQPKLRAAWETTAAKRTPEQKKLLSKHPAANVNNGTLYQYNQKAADELKKLDKGIKEQRAKKPAEEFLRVMRETPGKISKTRIFHRGDPKHPTDEVQPAALTIGSPPDRQRKFQGNDPNLPTTGRRLAYARWLTSGRHPLTARVLVNRVWQQHFGRGLVSTPDEFGKLGEMPTHPELLDWLADEFMASGWSLKQLHRTIMTSQVYRQSSKFDSARAAADPDNQLYWRKPVSRLDAEVVRDSILATSGALGSLFLGAPTAVLADADGQIVEGADPSRRSIYIQVRRSRPVSMLATFDAPVMEVNCAKRQSSTVAPQSLLMMNSKFVLKQAGKMSDRILKESPVHSPPKFAFDLDQLTAVMKAGWSFGYGRYTPSNKWTKPFTIFPYHDDKYWKGGKKMPDEKLGHTQIWAKGGHPGQFAAIRRWTSPSTGTVSFSGSFGHPSTNGTGVIGFLVSNTNELHGQWTIKTKTVKTELKNLKIKAGDTLDFIVDGNGSITSDSFTWTGAITLKSDNGTVSTWDVEKGFYGKGDYKVVPAQELPNRITRAWELAYGRPPSAGELDSALEFVRRQLEHLAGHPVEKHEPLKLAMSNLCQSLLNSNEFLYVD